MKKILPLLLILLLLTGCGSTEAAPAASPETQGPAQTPTQAPTEAVCLYDDGSTVEVQTTGAVRAYPLADDAETELYFMGQHLLVAFDDGIFTALRGEKGEVVATGMGVLATDRLPGELAAWDGGVMYFDRENRSVVLLDGNLQQSLSVDLPAESMGSPVLQADGDIFYCVPGEIRAMNIHTGISRLVRQHSCVSQELTGSFFGDTIIGCRLTDEAGHVRTLFISAQTGEAIHTATTDIRLETWEDRYFASVSDDGTRYVFGSADTESMYLTAPDANMVGLPAMNAAVGYTQEEDGLQLNYYDLTTGKCTSRVKLPGVGLPEDVACDGNSLWLTAGGVLYRWDVSMTTVTPEQVYTQLRYTLDNPDLEGLTACQARVDILRQTYGLNLYIWEDAGELAQKHTAEIEHRVSTINSALDHIEGFLEKCPPEFLPKAGDVTFYLVKNLKNQGQYHSYWEGTKCHVVLTSAAAEQTFYMGLGRVLDTLILGNSREFDGWDKLNPKGFKYTYDYEENAKRETVDKYLKAFVDQESMSFPTEDRCRIFAYAIMPGNEEYFENDAIQKKLIRICEGIREAYDLEKSTEVYIWEQYLKKPIAKKK